MSIAFGLPPPSLPLALAEASPALVLSRISSLSNSAIFTDEKEFCMSELLSF
jgi:hypothetical protein